MGQKYHIKTYTTVSALSKLEFTGFVCASTIITSKVMIEYVEGVYVVHPPGTVRVNTNKTNYVVLLNLVFNHGATRSKSMYRAFYHKYTVALLLTAPSQK